MSSEQDLRDCLDYLMSQTYKPLPISDIVLRIYWKNTKEFAIADPGFYAKVIEYYMTYPSRKLPVPQQMIDAVLGGHPDCHDDDWFEILKVAGGRIPTGTIAGISAAALITVTSSVTIRVALLRVGTADTAQTALYRADWARQLATKTSIGDLAIAPAPVEITLKESKYEQDLVYAIDYDYSLRSKSLIDGYISGELDLEFVLSASASYPVDRRDEITEYLEQHPRARGIPIPKAAGHGHISEFARQYPIN